MLIVEACVIIKSVHMIVMMGITVISRVITWMVEDCVTMQTVDMILVMRITMMGHG